MTSPGKLFLIPTVIADDPQGGTIPAMVKQHIATLQFFLAEDIRTARRYLSSLKVFPSIEALQFSVLDKNTKEADLSTLMQPLHNGHDMGVLSESGCPGIADPGALAARYAHDHGMEVIPLVGPSSLLLALMASGLNGQRFAFHGYLPIDSKECAAAIREYERESRLRQQTQLFIETPYRNNQLFGQLIKNLPPDTRLCVAIDITGPNQIIRTQTIRQWRSSPAEWAKAPAVFLFLSN